MSINRFLLTIGAALLACAVSNGAWAQGHAAPAEEAVEVEQEGMVFVGTVSVPVVRSGRVRYYEYGTVGLEVENTRKYLDTICKNRFHLADAFLVHLHSNPFTRGAEEDGPEASKMLLGLANQILGPDIVTSVNVVWSRTPMAAAVANAFGGRMSVVPCEAN